MALQNQEFLELTIPLDKLSAEDKETVTAFNRRFPPHDAYLETSGHLVVLKLKQLDFGRLEEFFHIQPTRLSKAVFEAVAQIKSYNIRGSKRIYANYGAERKVKDRKQKEQKRDKIYYAKDHSFSPANVAPPPEFENKILCGDSLELLKELPDNCVDLIFTSPPYNFGLDYQEQDDDHYWQDYFAQLFSIFAECIRVLKFGGRIAVNVQPLFSDYIPTHHIISNYFLSQKMLWKGEILWEKNNYNCKYTAWGSWKSPSSPYLKYTWEFIEVFCKGSLKKEGSQKNADITAAEFKDWVTAKWSIAPERKMKEFGHPAMFPEELAKRVIKLFSFRGDFVLDPFNGVGTTTFVAQQLGRRYLGIDIAEQYCTAARKRLQKED
ncbi:MAG TPA: DNA methylase [Firmicutes bacterium]|jgi:DNA modification methylase|nr:site-specific DNA-methyltransferase [Bacillota bacterium]HAA37517.1 DNA methylase [Bacillota bacterium]